MICEVEKAILVPEMHATNTNRGPDARPPGEPQLSRHCFKNRLQSFQISK